MSAESKAYIREITARSLDIIAVQNPTKEDYIMWYDRYGPSARKYIVPKKQKDIGHGKGVNHLPRFMAKRYARAMIIKLITEIADKQWVEDSKQYRTRDEKLQHAELVAIRTNDATLWKELTPKVWLGLVEKYDGDKIPDPPEPMIPDSGDAMEDAMRDLGLADKRYEPTRETV